MFISSCTFISFFSKFHYACLFHYAPLLDTSEYLYISIHDPDTAYGLLWAETIQKLPDNYPDQSLGSDP